MEPLDKTNAPEASSALFAEDIICRGAGFEGKIGAVCKVHCEAAVNA